ncbi:MAG: serine/threonine protein kinase, partial [Deltaproteobacteria bacterium]|nr:serine/threonine protein kinase [Nannocystaceae bacterium]
MLSLFTNRRAPRHTPILDDPGPGRTIGKRYILQRMIGRGGGGDVYLAIQSALGSEPERDVVVKLLAGRLLDDVDAIARFEREAERLRAIDHPNIVSMFDSGVDNGRPYLVTEWIDGELLTDYITRLGRLGMREFIPIAAQVLKGIGHAHSREMMIRDIKPSNIMLCQRKGRSNFVKVLDFGLAKFMRNEAPLTEGYVIGTAGYLAPEAIVGDPLDLRVDVYALGVLFYHMLAGEPPFAGCEDATIFYKTINDRPRALVELLPADHGVPEGLLELIDDCLAKDVSQRPADANIVVERLIDV